MRIKYKAPGQFFFRRFWRVKSWVMRQDGTIERAVNARGCQLFLPPGMVVVLVKPRLG